MMSLAAEGQFKDYYSDEWFGTYALREFDKIAPVPGVNWFVEDAQDWLARAQRDGWVIKRKPSEAIPGSIILGFHEGLAWVGIAREVTDKGLIFETVMGGDGTPARYWINFSDLAAAIHFKGCILPLRNQGVPIASPMMDYKGIPGHSGAAWPAKEFDVLAPKPGLNWQGAERDWAVEAARKGWIVISKPSLIKKGSLLIWDHPKRNRTIVAFVREVTGPVIIFDFVDTAFSRIITARLTHEQMLDSRAFGGLVFQAAILPLRKNR